MNEEEKKAEAIEVKKGGGTLKLIKAKYGLLSPWSF